MNGIRLVEVSGDACAGCLALLPELRETAQKFQLGFVRLDIQSNPEAIEKYRIEKIPTVLLLDGEEIIAKCSGYQPQEILELWVEAKLEEYRRVNE